MRKFFRFIFGIPECSIVNKYHEGDICFWPSIIDSMVEPTVRITNWYRYYDSDKDKEIVLYDAVDIYNGKKWCEINEDELQLLAFADEMAEMDEMILCDNSFFFGKRGIHLFS